MGPKMVEKRWLRRWVKAAGESGRGQARRKSGRWGQADKDGGLEQWARAAGEGGRRGRQARAASERSGREQWFKAAGESVKREQASSETS
jgi:hypothetical protein